MIDGPEPTDIDPAPAPRADWRWWQVLVSIAAALGIAGIPTGPMVLTLLSDWEPAGDYGYAAPQEPLLKEFLPIPIYDDSVAEEVQEAPEPPDDEEEEPVAAEAEAPPAPPMTGAVVPPTEATEPTLDLMLPEATEEQLLAYADGEADGDGTSDAESYGDGDPESEGTSRAGQRDRRRPGKKSSSSRKPPKPCTDFHPAIVKVTDSSYNVERALVEYYATHIFELQQLGGVWTHKGTDGKPDGFQIGIRRCGILWQTGFRSRDIVHSVNGRTITTIFQALQAYFALRSDEVFVVELVRRGKPMTLTYTLIDDRTKKEIRADQKAMKDEKRAARQAERAEAKDAATDASGSK